MIDLQKLKELTKDGLGLTRKEAMSLLGVRSYKTFSKRVKRGDIVKVIVGGETCYHLKIDRD